MVTIKPEFLSFGYNEKKQCYQVDRFEKNKSWALLLPSDIKERGLEVSMQMRNCYLHLKFC